MYNFSMTKKEMIERYGQAHYDAHLAKTREAAKAWYWANPDRRKTAEESTAAVRRWLANPANRTKFNEANKVRQRERYQAMSPEERLANAQERRAARKAKLACDPVFAAKQAAKQAARFKRWTEAHPGLNRQRSAAYEKAHPEVKRANKQTRRALGKVAPAFVKFLYAQPCVDCGTTERKRTIGHLIPVARNGTNHPCNLIAQCRSCNSKQHMRIHPRFAIAHYPEAAQYAAA
jgi:DNA helicase IV